MVLWRDAVDLLHLILCFHSRKTEPEMTKNDGVNIITTAYKSAEFDRGGHKISRRAVFIS